MTATVGFIGAGQLGEPMVRRLLGAGRPVQVYARRSEVRDRLRSCGAGLADSVAELADQADIVISCLFSDAQLREVTTGPDGLIAYARPGSILVSHTTGSVATLAELAASAPKLAVVDAPVSGTADDIAAGTLTVLVGGAEEVIDRIRPVLDAYASPIVVTGGMGTALHLKLINNLLFVANLSLLSAAADLGQQFGIESRRLFDALEACSGGSIAASHVRAVGGVDVLLAGAGSYLRKDVTACVEAAEKVGANLGPLGAVIKDGPLGIAGQLA